MAVPLLDASTPAAVGFTTVTAAKATAAFSPPAGAVLYCCVATAGTNVTGNVVSSVVNSGTALTWTLLKRENTFAAGALTGTAEVWWAYNPAAQTNITVTATLNVNPSDTTPAGLLRVLVITGAKSDQTGAATTSQQSSTGATMSAAVTTTRPNSWVWGVVFDWSNATSPTAGSGVSVDSTQLNGTSSDGGWTLNRTATTPASGTSVTVNATAPATIHLHAVVFEILAAIDLPARAARRRVSAPRRAGATRVSAVPIHLPAPAPPGFVQAVADGSRRPLPRVRRPRLSMPVPAQVPVPPIIPPNVMQPRRTRGWRLVRARVVTPVRPQDAPVTIVDQPRRAHGWRLFRGHQATPVPPQVPVPPYIPALIAQPRRARGWRLFRARLSTPVAPQIPVPPTIPTPQVVQPRRARGLGRRRAQPAVPPTATDVPPATVDPSRRPRVLRRARARVAEPPWTITAAPIAPAYPPAAASQPRRIRGLMLRRGRVVTPVSPQVPVPPMIPTPAVVQPRRLRGWRRARGRQAEPPWTVAAPTTPTYPPANTSQPRRLRGLVARRRPSTLVHAQPHPPAPATVRRPRGAPWSRHGRAMVAPAAQPIPAISLFTPRRARAFLRRRNTIVTPPTRPPTIPRVPEQPRRRRPFHWLRRALRWVPVRPPVTGDQPGDAAISVDLAYDAEILVEHLGDAEISVDELGTVVLELELVGDAQISVELLGDANLNPGGRMGYDVGKVVRVVGKAYNKPPTEGGVLTDPTGATCKVKAPDGTETTFVWLTDLGVIHDGVGLFHFDVATTQPEDWVFRWVFIGAVAAAAETTIIVPRSKFTNP